MKHPIRVVGPAGLRATFPARYQPQPSSRPRSNRTLRPCLLSLPHELGNGGPSAHPPVGKAHGQAAMEPYPVPGHETQPAHQSDMNRFRQGCPPELQDTAMGNGCPSSGLFVTKPFVLYRAELYKRDGLAE